MAGEFFRTVVAEAGELKLTSDEHIWTRPASETACHLDGGNRLQSYIRPIDLGDSA